MSVRRKIAYSLVVFLLFYASLECIATTLYMFGRLEPHSLYIDEISGSTPTIKFDAIRGYRRTRAAARTVIVASNGVIETQGTILGNNEGFPDRDDFQPVRQDSPRRRFVVFGDSFTAAQFLRRNWPDKAEDLTSSSDRSLELLNCSLDGGGLVNWWSIVTRFLEPQQYDLDGVIFAVYGDDLRRPFAISDHSISFGGRRRPVYGFVPIHQFHRLPATFEQALPYFRPFPEWDFVSPERFDMVLRQEWLPPVGPGFRFYLTERCVQGVRRLTSRDLPVQVTNPGQFDPARQKMISDIGGYLSRKGIPALVVYIPTRAFLLGDPSGDYPRETRSFAESLGVTFIDAGEAFRGLSRQEIREHWLPYDGHWNQQGSDRFAKFMVQVLSQWPAPSE